MRLKKHGFEGDELVHHVATDRSDYASCSYFKAFPGQAMTPVVWWRDVDVDAPLSCLRCIYMEAIGE